MLARLFGESQAVMKAKAEEVLPPWHPTSKSYPFSCINTHEPAQQAVPPQNTHFPAPWTGLALVGRSICTSGTVVPCLSPAHHGNAHQLSCFQHLNEAPLQSPRPRLSKTVSNFITAVSPLWYSWSARFSLVLPMWKAWSMGLSQRTCKIDRKG